MGLSRLARCTLWLAFALIRYVHFLRRIGRTPDLFHPLIILFVPALRVHKRVRDPMQHDCLDMMHAITTDWHACQCDPLIYPTLLSMFHTSRC